MLVFLVYFLSQIVASVVAFGIFAAIEGTEALENPDVMDPVLFLVAGAAGLVVGGPAVVLVARALQPGRTRAEKLAPFGWVRAKPAAIGLAALAGAVLALVLGFGTELVFPPDKGVHGPLIEAASAPGWQRIVFVILAILLAPLVEEFLFRGVMFTGFSRSWGKWPAAIFVTVLFALLHIFDVAGYWPALGAIMLVGAAMLVARIKTNSLGPPIAMHATYNAVQVVALYLTL